MKESPKGKGYGVHLNHGKVHVNLTSVWEDDAIRVETEEALAAERWYHVTVTYTGSRWRKAYTFIVDGRPLKVLWRRNIGRSYNTNDGFMSRCESAPAGDRNAASADLLTTCAYTSALFPRMKLAVLAVGEPAGEIARKPAAERSRNETLALRS